MNFRKTFTFLALYGAASSAFAIDGKKQYEMLCGACHSADGKGAGGGSFPPLAGSRWVKGDPERLVQIVLHGLEGPVNVLDKSYNLAMPPQGAALTDEQIAAITTYVRGAWGNKQDAITPDLVKQARIATAERHSMWKVEELLKEWPLPPKKGPLKNLRATIYNGKFKKMPNFAELEPDDLEEDQTGFLDLNVIDRKNDYAVVWEGDFTPKVGGSHTFTLDSDDGARVFVNEKLVAEIKGLGPMGRKVEVPVALGKRSFRLRVEYFQFKGGQGLSLTARKGEHWLRFTKPKTEIKPSKPKPIPFLAKEEARIFRNFIKGSTARAIGVGYPEQVNLTFSADQLAMDLAWIGDFMDAGLHWTGRGKGWQLPAGQRVVNFGVGPAFALQLNELGAWPTAWQPGVDATFGGYILDKKRRPEFRYHVAGLDFRDKPIATSERELVRNIRIKAGENPPQDLSLRLSGGGAKALGSHAFELVNGVRLEVTKGRATTPVVTPDGVVLRLKPQPGENRIGLRYVWR